MDEALSVLATDLKEIDACEAGHGLCEGCAYTVEVSSLLLSELSALMNGAQSLREFWDGLSKEERKRLRSKAGKAAWRKHGREEMSRRLRKGHRKETKKERRERARKGALGLHAKYSKDVIKEWQKRGGEARAANRKRQQDHPED